MNNICVIYNSAARYREPIFTLMDETYHIDWFFDTRLDDIKQMDCSKLKRVSRLKNLYIKRPLYWQRGAVSNLWNKKYDIYIILGDTFCLSTWLFVILQRFFWRKKKVYFWTHGWYGKENVLARILKRIYFKMPDGIFLYGNHAKQLMIGEGFDANKLFVIHNSLDYQTQVVLRNRMQQTGIFSAHFANDNPVLLFIGRLTAVKRLDLLIEAISILKRRGSMYNLVLVGDGVKGEELKNLVIEKEVDNQVWFYGACYDEGKNAELIYNADVCVAPGNVGLTAMHVMVFGTPVITHNNFALQMPEFEAVKEGETGAFFKYNDVEDMVRCISEWFQEHKKDRESVRQKCYAEIDTQWTPWFQIEVMKNVINEN